MDSSPPPEPPPLPTNAPEPLPPQDEGLSLRKVIWVVLAVAVVVPLVWGPSLIALAFGRQLFGIKVLNEGFFVMVLPVPVDLAIAIGVAGWGLRRNWHLRPGVLLGWSIGAVCIIALIAVAVPAFNRVRYSGEEKTVISNIRGLAAAADQYYLENGATNVALHHLVGPTSYIKALNLVAGEKYPTHYTQGVTITVTGIAGARTVTYAP